MITGAALHAYPAIGQIFKETNPSVMRVPPVCLEYKKRMHKLKKDTGFAMIVPMENFRHLSSHHLFLRVRHVQTAELVNGRVSVYRVIGQHRSKKSNASLGISNNVVVTMKSLRLILNVEIFVPKHQHANVIIIFY
tara:strand:+ start:73 stop:480 length:408 start_codon:yes stop_codon:yes gene_type:complete